MINKTFVKFLFLLFFALTGYNNSQTTREEFFSDSLYTCGLYYPYKRIEYMPTPVPKGYVPFYITHYGRHGSRWVLSPDCHLGPLKILAEADSNSMLTETGKSLMQRLKVAAADAEYRYGDLSPLGIREQKGIAERMFKAYPEVFSAKNTPKCIIYSRSTQVPRCILSMAAFNERLKEFNPNIDILWEASQKNKYLNNEAAINSDTTKKLETAFLKKHFPSGRFISRLIKDSIYAQRAIKDPEKFANQVFLAAINIPNLDHLHFTLLDVFTPEEKYILWQTANMHMYYLVGPSGINGRSTVRSASLLLKDILTCAEKAIMESSISADLRFGHDSYIIPLAAILEIQDLNNRESEPEKIYKAWSSFKASPMGANLQIVFFRNHSNNDILLKILYNEKEVRIPVQTDIAPYYHWNDFKSYYEKKLTEN